MHYWNMKTILFTYFKFISKVLEDSQILLSHTLLCKTHKHKISNVLKITSMEKSMKNNELMSALKTHHCIFNNKLFLPTFSVILSIITYIFGRFQLFLCIKGYEVFSTDVCFCFAKRDKKNECWKEVTVGLVLGL